MTSRQGFADPRRPVAEPDIAVVPAGITELGGRSSGQLDCGSYRFGFGGSTIEQLFLDRREYFD